MKQDDGDMFMKGMHQFKEPLANIKTPMDMGMWITLAQGGIVNFDKKL